MNESAQRKEHFRVCMWMSEEWKKKHPRSPHASHTQPHLHVPFK